MSSTNVHSSNQKHICCGQTIATEESNTITIPPKASGRGPSIIEVLEGPQAEITASEGIAVKDKGSIEAIASCDKKGDIQKLEISDIIVVNVGHLATIKQAIDELKTRTSKNEGKDRD